MPRLQWIVGPVVLLASFVTPVFADPLADALAAERRDDCVTAVSLYQSLAAHGSAEALKRLGYFNEIGYCAKRDWVEAAKWYAKAIAAGDQSSAGSLGHIGRNWRFMYPKSPLDPTVYRLVEVAAQNGSAVLQFSLGVMNYPIGDAAFDGTHGNLREALIWYRRAANQGDVDAQAAIALAYADGVGVPQDYIEAHKWLNIAASLVPDIYPDIRIDLMRRRDELAAKMTAAQLADAQKLASEWKAMK